MLQEKHRDAEFPLNELLKELSNFFRRYNLLSYFPGFRPHRQTNNCAIKRFTVPVVWEEILKGLEMVADRFDGLRLDRKTNATSVAERRLGVEDD